MINFYSNMSFDEMMKEISYENYSFVSVDKETISVKLK